MSGSTNKRLSHVYLEADIWRKRAEWLTRSLRQCHPSSEPRIRAERDAASAVVAAMESYAAAVNENRHERMVRDA